MSSIRDRSPRKTAFVFAGGGSHGAVQVGMLRLLVARGIKPDMVVGSSVGAMNAAFFAGSPSAAGVAALEQVWRSLRRKDIFPLSWRALLGFARRSDFLMTADGLRRLIREHIPYCDLAQAQIPLHVVATDILSGEPVIMSNGPAEDAIVASAAIPAAFEPLCIGGRYLVDGALTSNTPIRAAVACGARRIIVLPTTGSVALDSPPRGAVAAALHAITLLIARQLSIELQGLDRSIECHVVPTPKRMSGAPYDFSHTAEMIEHAAECTAAWLDGNVLTRAQEFEKFMPALMPAPA
jgi:NTE family protein